MPTGISHIIIGDDVGGSALPGPLHDVATKEIDSKHYGIQLAGDLEGNAICPDDGAYILYEGVKYTVKRVNAVHALLGANIVLAAVTGKRILATTLRLNAYNTVNAAITDSDGTTLDGPYHLLESAGVVCNENKRGWFITPVSKGVSMNLSDAVSVLINFSYIEV